MKIYVALILCIFAFNTYAGQKAVTEQGDIVILNDDGTWRFEEGKPVTTTELKTNPGTFTKPEDSNFILKSARTDSTFAINAKKWSFKKNANDHESAEYVFKLKNSDLHGLVITEGVEVQMVQLTNIAFENAKKAAADAKIVKREYRIVNGKKVIYMEMVGTIQSIKFKYLGYYFSNSTGSTQYIVFTGANLVDKYQQEIEELLNGFLAS